ncbi:hypothetical protein EPO44_05685 [bacterium]|nr:MAG: hypothetical protein EPO44_05685 [bacterium]
MKESPAQGEDLIARVKGIGGIVLGVSGNRNWIELLYEGDLMHTKQVDLPSDTLFDIFVEEIPHKCTVFEHPRTLIYLNGPCNIEICRDGNKIIVREYQPKGGSKNRGIKGLSVKRKKEKKHD